MDGDLQHPPATVPRLRQAVKGSEDLVVASRYLENGSAEGLETPLRNVISRACRRSAKALFPDRLSNCSDPMSGFFAVRLASLDLESVTQCGYKVLLALLISQNLTASEIPFVFAQRNAGSSKASLAEGCRFFWLLIRLKSAALATRA